MGVNVVKKRLSDFRSEESLRCDYKYITSLVTSSKDFYTYHNLFDFVSYEKVNIEELDNFKYAEIGNVNKLGEVEPVELSFEDRQEENESLFKKIEKGDIINPKKNDILISKIRPYLNKNVLVNSDDEYFTKTFIHIRPKINSELLHIAIRSKFITLLNAVSRQGKGYPTLKEDDIKAIRFPRKFVDALTKNEDELIKKIQPIRTEISGLKLTQQTTLDILNQVFSAFYKINLSQVQEIDKTRILTIPLSNLKNYNSGLRGSLRWNKMQYIQNFIYSNVDCVETLGRYIKSTKNGWSPLSVEGGEGTPVLGQEHFSSNTILKIDPSKFTEQTRNNIEDFFIKKGDFFVSRGNTVDLKVKHTSDPRYTKWETELVWRSLKTLHKSKYDCNVSVQYDYPENGDDGLYSILMSKTDAGMWIYLKYWENGEHAHPVLHISSETLERGTAFSMDGYILTDIPVTDTDSIPDSLPKVTVTTEGDTISYITIETPATVEDTHDSTIYTQYTPDILLDCYIDAPFGKISLMEPRIVK